MPGATGLENLCTYGTIGSLLTRFDIDNGPCFAHHLSVDNSPSVDSA
jgi:hypothetical protein